MSKVDQLFETNPFEFTIVNQQLFVDSFRENAAHHYKHNPYIHYLWNRNGFHPDMIQDEESLFNVPYTMVNLFKENELYTGAHSDITLKLGSSGTSGQRSMIYLNDESLNRVKKLAYNIHDSLGMVDNKIYNYLCFTYDPKIAGDLGTAFTDELLTSFTKKNEVFYTFQHDGDEFFFNEEETVKTLKRFASSKFPTRILGFPAFLYKILTKYDLKLDLGIDSWLQTGGGWKGEADLEIPKDKFRDMVSTRLGIPLYNIRDLFGMVEHGIPYVDGPDGKLRIPNYARVIIRDPKSLKPLPYGEKGLIQFLCSYNSSFPAISLLTTDWGRVLRGDKDESGIYSGDHIEILGRAGLKLNIGCALKAAKMLEES